jgi:two-component sensor histidine kinase
MRREGSFGVLPAEIATPLVMVLNELLQNAVEHAFAPGAAGEVVVYAERHRKQLRVTVADNGVGLPVDFTLDASERLGLQIVRTLARGELRGTINLRTRPEGGTTAELLVPLARK